MDTARPTTGACAHCGRTFTLNAKGRPAKFCRPACRVMAFEKAHPRPPKATRVPFKDRVARRIWDALADAKLVVGELPPKREQESGR